MFYYSYTWRNYESNDKKDKLMYLYLCTMNNVDLRAGPSTSSHHFDSTRRGSFQSFQSSNFRPFHRRHIRRDCMIQVRGRLRMFRGWIFSGDLHQRDFLKNVTIPRFSSSHHIRTKHSSTYPMNISTRSSQLSRLTFTSMATL